MEDPSAMSLNRSSRSKSVVGGTKYAKCDCSAKTAPGSLTRWPVLRLAKLSPGMAGAKVASASAMASYKREEGRRIYV